MNPIGPLARSKYDFVGYQERLRTESGNRALESHVALEWERKFPPMCSEEVFTVRDSVIIEEIPASELEASQMFTTATDGTEEDLNEIEQLVRDAEVSDEAQSIAGLLRRLISATVGDGTRGKARVRRSDDVGEPINVIPVRAKSRLARA